MSEPKFKSGQFISTTIGRMRVKKSHNDITCSKCALSIKDKCGRVIKCNCDHLYDKYNSSCCNLIGEHGYLEKV